MPPTSSSAQAGPSSIPLCTFPRPKKRVRRDEGQDAGEGEDEEPPTYRLLELPDEIAGMIEEAQRARDGDEAEGGEAGEGLKGSKRARAAGKEAAVPHLIINGRHSDSAVLCTPTRTYALRQVTQSNSLLLCSLPSPHPSTSTSTPRLTLRSNVTDILELQPVVPRLERIAELLEGSAYAGEDEEDKGKGRRRLYTVREVRSVVQASDEEMQRGLDERCVLELDGHLRLLSPTYLLTLIDSLLLICSSNSYLPHAIPLRECVDALMADYGGRARREVFEAMLTRWFGEEKEQGTVELDGRKVARFVGLELLKLKEKSGGKKGGSGSSDAISRLPLLDDFMAEWRTRLGDVFSTSHRDEGGSSSTTTTTTHGLVDLSLLRGQYLLHADPLSASSSSSSSGTITTNPKRTTSSASSRATPRQRISYYPSSHLPLEPAARFQSLFTTRAQWQLDDLLPFIEDVAPEAKRREALLLRFARAKKMGDGMVYSSRVRY